MRQGATWGPLMSGQDQRVQICRPERPQAQGTAKAREDGLGGGGCGMVEMRELTRTQAREKTNRPRTGGDERVKGEVEMRG